MRFVNGYMQTGMAVKCTNNIDYVTFSGWNGLVDSTSCCSVVRELYRRFCLELSDKSYHEDFLVSLSAKSYQ